MKTSKPQSWLSATLGGLVLGAALQATGCGVIATPFQVTAGGQTLPSAYYIQDDVQYFAESEKFAFRNEEAGLTEAPPGR